MLAGAHMRTCARVPEAQWAWSGGADALFNPALCDERRVAHSTCLRKCVPSMRVGELRCIRVYQAQMVCIALLHCVSGAMQAAAAAAACNSNSGNDISCSDSRSGGGSVAVVAGAASRFEQA